MLFYHLTIWWLSFYWKQTAESFWLNKKKKRKHFFLKKFENISWESLTNANIFFYLTSFKNNSVQTNKQKKKRFFASQTQVFFHSFCLNFVAWWGIDGSHVILDFV